MPRLVLLSLLVRIVAGCSGERCVDVLHLPMVAEGAGDWRVELRLDDRSVVCTAHLPADDQGARCNDDDVELALNRTTLDGPAEGDFLGDLTVYGTPETVEVALVHDGAPLHTDRFTPAYAATDPGAEGGRTCEAAEAVIGHVGA